MTTATLIGDTATSFPHEHTLFGDAAWIAEFEAGATGIVNELHLTAGPTVTGVTSVELGIYATPQTGLGSEAGELLGVGTFSGKPSPGQTITVSGLSAPVHYGSTYWLAVCPQPIGSELTVRMAVEAVGGGGTGFKEASQAGGIGAGKAWSGDLQWGPLNFYATGELGGFTGQLIERLQPWLTPDLQLLATALGAMFEPILALAEESGSDGEKGYIPAWGRLFEVGRANLGELRYMSNYVGVEVPKGATEEEARTLIKAEAGLERGTPKALNMAIERVLGSEPFAITERTNANLEVAAYYFLVHVAVGKGSQALYNAINAVIPAGIFYTIVEGEGWITGVKEHWTEIATAKWTELKEPEY